MLKKYNNGTWENNYKTYCKVGNTDADWRDVKMVYAKINGVWKPIQDDWTYSWYTSSWGACSKTCGGGTQTRTVNCRRVDNGNEVVSDSYCSGTKPATSQPCNTQSCTVCQGNASTYEVFWACTRYTPTNSCSYQGRIYLRWGSTSAFWYHVGGQGCDIRCDHDATFFNWNHTDYGGYRYTRGESHAELYSYYICRTPL